MILQAAHIDTTVQNGRMQNHQSEDERERFVGDMSPLPSSTVSNGTRSYFGCCCDSVCFTQVYQIEPSRIIPMEQARPLDVITLGISKH